MTLSVALACATSPRGRGIFHFGVSRNFTFRKAENFTLRREQAPALRGEIFSLRRRRNFTLCHQNFTFRVAENFTSARAETSLCRETNLHFASAKFHRTAARRKKAAQGTPVPLFYSLMRPCQTSTISGRITGRRLVWRKKYFCTSSLRAVLMAATSGRRRPR